MAHRPTPCRAAAALEQFTPGLATARWIVDRLGEGVQAEVYSVRAPGGGPLWGGETDLVLKLYKPGPGREAVASEELESLALLNAALDGRVVDGWSVRTPAPLSRGDRPHALLMTRVPGRPLNAHLREARGDHGRALGSLPGVVVSALGSFWESTGRTYGDLDFNNILCDPGARTLAFVDPGTPGPDYLCDGVSRDWFPASRDLANMLFEVAVSVKPHLGRPAARARQWGLLKATLGAFVGGINPGLRDRLLDEVHACAHSRLRGVRPGWSPAGAWRLFLKGYAARGVDRVLGDLKAVTAAERRPAVAAYPRARGATP